MSKYQVKTTSNGYQVFRIDSNGNHDVYGTYTDAMDALCHAVELNL